MSFVAVGADEEVDVEVLDVGFEPLLVDVAPESSVPHEIAEDEGDAEGSEVTVVLVAVADVPELESPPSGDGGVFPVIALISSA